MAGSHHLVLGYLVAEDLQQQPESVQTFLLQTSILDRLTGSLCDAVRFGFSGSPTGQEDGRASLDRLAHANQGFDLTAEAGRLDHRVLVLFGEDDPSGVPLVEETLAALRSADTEFALLKRCGHFWHECPDQFHPRVRAFLALVGSQEREITQ